MVLALLPTRAHRDGCTFGPGFFKVVHWDGGQRRVTYFDSSAEADNLVALLPPGAEARGYRDACLDRRPESDATTPDVVDAEWWLGLPKAQAMEELGLRSEADYATAHRMVTDAVYTRDNRRDQGGVHVPIVIKRKRAPWTEHLFRGGNLTRIRPAR